MVSLSEFRVRGYFAEMETSEPVRDGRVSERLFTELGHKFCRYGCSIVALELPIRNQTLCVDHPNDAF
jgi:hypothetical protein